MNPTLLAGILAILALVLALVDQIKPAFVLIALAVLILCLPALHL